MQYRIVTPDRLTPAEWKLWDRTQRNMPELESPYFRPEFTQAVAAVHDGVEIAVLEKNGETLGFFPFQRGPLGLGRPVGGKLNDFHGVIAPPGVEVDPARLVKACRLNSWDFDHFVGPQPAFLEQATEHEESAYLDLSGGYEAYVEATKTSGTEIVRKTVSRERKFTREVGPLRFELHTPRHDVLEKLIAWKVSQFERTGFMNLFAFPWTKRLLQQILAKSRPELSAMLSVLWFGDQPIAIAYSLRSFHAAHAWFIAYDSHYGTYSPGTIMMLKLAEQAAAAGVTRLHLGAGDQRFKQSLASGSIPVAIGSVERAGFGTALRKAWRWSRSKASSLSFGKSLTLPTWCTHGVRSWFAFR